MTREYEEKRKGTFTDHKQCERDRIALKSMDREIDGVRWTHSRSLDISKV